MDARELHGLAASQRWLLTQEQVLRHLTPGQLEHALRRGELVRVFDRVYKPWGAPEWWDQRLQAACWSVEGVASHRAGARVHRIGGVPAVRLELTVPRERQVRVRGMYVHRSNLLLPEFVTAVDGIPVTTPDRTCIDLSAVVSPTVLESAWSSAQTLGLISPDSLRRTVVRMMARGRRRMSLVHELLASWVPGYDKTDSELEARVLRWLREVGIQEPELQFWTVAGGHRFCLDLAWPAEKVCVECDGFGSHGNRLRFDSDRDKIPELELAGWLVIPVTSRHPRHTVLDRVQRALAQRS